MFCFLSSSFAKSKLRKNNNKASRYVARDDLDAKHKKGVAKGATKPVYNPDMKQYDNQHKGTVRVKVVMTKAEAMKFFSKCDRGSGTLSFTNVAAELSKIPANHVSLVHPWSPSNEVVLESIAEEP